MGGNVPYLYVPSDPRCRPYKEICESRTLLYSVSLDAHIESVFNTVQMPIEMFGRPIVLPEPIYDVDNRNSK
jgi:hypothetical protein